MKLLKRICFLLSLLTLSSTILEGKEKSNEILPILQERYSGRSYDEGRAISQEQIFLLAEAARAAPSCYNDQPWHFIICNRETDEVAYQKVFNALVEFNQGWAKEASVLIVVLADSKFRHNQELNRWGSYDTGAAAFSMMLQATAMGLMAHQMGGFDNEQLRQEFKIPAQYSIMSVMAIGYEKSGEEVKRERRALGENFFKGAWGKPLK